jgi:hypothetical protein
MSTVIHLATALMSAGYYGEVYILWACHFMVGGGSECGLSVNLPTSNHTPCLCPHMTKWPHVVIVTITHLHGRTHVRTHKHTLAQTCQSQMLQTSHHATRDLTHTHTHTHTHMHAHPPTTSLEESQCNTHPLTTQQLSTSVQQMTCELWIQFSVRETGVSCRTGTVQHSKVYSTVQ